MECRGRPSWPSIGVVHILLEPPLPCPSSPPPLTQLTLCCRGSLKRKRKKKLRGAVDTRLFPGARTPFPFLEHELDRVNKLQGRTRVLYPRAPACQASPCTHSPTHFPTSSAHWPRPRSAPVRDRHGLPARPTRSTPPGCSLTARRGPAHTRTGSRTHTRTPTHTYTADPSRPTRPMRAHTRTSRARFDAAAYYTQHIFQYFSYSTYCISVERFFH